MTLAQRQALARYAPTAAKGRRVFLLLDGRTASALQRRGLVEHRTSTASEIRGAAYTFGRDWHAVTTRQTEYRLTDAGFAYVTANLID